MVHVIARSVVVCFLAVALAGCAAPGTRRTLAGDGTASALKTGDIVETADGRTISFDTLIDDLSKARIVYVGETHASAEDHRVQKAILQGLYERNQSIILALEMFPRESQPILDKYAKGTLIEEPFLKEVNWDGIWGYPFQLYRGVLSFARDKHLRIIGINAPKDVVNKIARTGLSSLSPQQRRRIATDFHLEDPAHRDLVKSEYELHGKEQIRDFEAFYEAQLAWEETMSETLAATLSSLSGSEQIVVLIGKGHISHREGVPSLTKARIDSAYKTVAAVPLDYPGTAADPNIADYVWITEKSQSMPRGRLGIMIGQPRSGDGIEIVAVAPDSPAEKSGLLKGDIIIAIDGTSIKDLNGLHAAIAHEEAEHKFTVKRGAKTLTLPVHFSR